MILQLLPNNNNHYSNFMKQWKNKRSRFQIGWCELIGVCCLSCWTYCFCLLYFDQLDLTTYCVWFHSLHFKDNHSKLCHVHTNDYDDVVDDTISSLKTFWSWPLVWIYLVQMKCILCTCMYKLFISSKVTTYFYVDH